MSKLMLVFGILFLAAGVALGFLIEFQPGQMQVLALTPEVAALFLVGGALCLGLGNVAAALRELPARNMASAELTETQPELSASTPVTPRFRGFGSRAAATAAVVATEVKEAKEAVPEPLAKTSVADTISALEQAKSDIAVALGVETYDAPVAAPAPAADAPPVIMAPAPKADDEASKDANDESDLFVVEEKVIRGRPARILSDNTVEAETDEGWMRFENLEHLDEYLDAAVPET
jgi:hypothetical protein